MKELRIIQNYLCIGIVVVPNTELDYNPDLLTSLIAAVAQLTNISYNKNLLFSIQWIRYHCL